MQKCDLIKVEIIDVSNEGNGIARISSDTDSSKRVIFVQGATIGDEAICEITKIKKNYALAKTKSIITESPFRITAEDICPHLEEGCGGCNIGHLNYTKQLDLKSERVRNALTRIGGFDLEEEGILFEDIIPSYNEKAYRNKAVFSVKGSKIGFLKAKSSDVVECPYCQIVMPEILKAVSGLSDFLIEYPEYSRNIERFMVRVGDYSQVMTVIFGSPSEIKHMQELADYISDKCELVSLFGVDIIRKITNNNRVKLDKNIYKTTNAKTKQPELIAGRKTIQKTVANLIFEVGPDAFFQVNEDQTPILYAKAREYAYVRKRESAGAIKEVMIDIDSDTDVSLDSNIGSDSKKTIVDLYCGVGTIGLSMSANDNYIIGVESNKEAVLNANRNAVINSITDARYFHGPAEDILPRIIADGIGSFKVKKIDLMVMDPPRVGCERDLLDAIGHVLPKSIVYVSCDPATFARDAAILCEEYGYKLEKVCPIDMFPGSLNVETVAKLSN